MPAQYASNAPDIAPQPHYSAAKMPSPPTRPADASPSALLAHWHAVNNWIEKEVRIDLHGEGAIDAGADILSEVYDELSNAPCLTMEDALAKVQLLLADDDGMGPCGDEVKRPILDQLADFLSAKLSAEAAEGAAR